MTKLLRDFARTEDGSVAIEYALGAAVIAVGLLPAFEGLADALAHLHAAVGENLSQPQV